MEYTLDNIERAFKLLDGQDAGLEAEISFYFRCSNGNTYNCVLRIDYCSLTYRLWIRYGTNVMNIISQSQDGVIAMVKHFVEQEF